MIRKMRHLKFYEKGANSELFKKITYTEAATRRVHLKKAFLEISQNSQENTCATF